MKHTANAVWVWLAAFIAVVQGQSIPGTKQTLSGYDTSSGVDAICWKSNAAAEGEGGQSFENELVHSFEVDYRGVQMLEACPLGNNVSGTQPIEHSLYGERLRTRRLYDYPVKLNLNLTSLHAPQGFTSDRGPGYVVAQIFNCVAGLSGFCSPFIHEQTIAQAIAAARGTSEIQNNAQLLENNNGYSQSTEILTSGSTYSSLLFQPRPLPILVCSLDPLLRGDTFLEICMGNLMLTADGFLLFFHPKKDRSTRTLN